VNSVLVIAGADSSGGAGLSRDIATLARLGVRVQCALTAVTAQTDAELREQLLLPAALVRVQIEAALATHRPQAVKVGMLGNADIVTAVAAVLPPRAQLPLVLDPVLCASSGAQLLDAAGCRALLELLLPRASLVTPNIPEAAALLGESPARSEAQLLQQARALLARGAAAVLLKGGHGEGAEASDLLLQQDGALQWLRAPRQQGVQRGTGCTLASAIAGHLAHGVELSQACAQAKDFVSRRWQSAD
jgi:hydroxymethylpyrimidine/phosphomethylpyrimidine kinase